MLLLCRKVSTISWCRGVETCRKDMTFYQRRANDPGFEEFLVDLQVMVIVLWISTAVALAFLLAEFVLKYEHVRFLLLLVSRRLTVCHDRTLIILQRVSSLTPDGVAVQILYEQSAL